MTSNPFATHWRHCLDLISITYFLCFVRLYVAYLWCCVVSLCAGLRISVGLFKWCLVRSAYSHTRIIAYSTMVGCQSSLKHAPPWKVILGHIFCRAQKFAGHTKGCKFKSLTLISLIICSLSPSAERPHLPEDHHRAPQGVSTRAQEGHHRLLVLCQVHLQVRP